ncbi:MAG: ATP-dependent endonuclease [Lachnospiraceae bacterium]|nr:ATP-dependent endonuclease [Lachnospiraceae bacterium]
MKVVSAHIRNFRMLREMDIDFEDTLSLIIGKNNSGKTSFLIVLQRFLSENKQEFVFEDFSLEVQQKILELEKKSLKAEEYNEIALSLKLVISYKQTDNLGTASKLLLDLDNSKTHLVILFEYVLTYEKYLKLVKDYAEYRGKGIERDFQYYVSNNIRKYFDIRIKALEYGNESNFKIITNDIVQSIISMETIWAKRDVDNEQGKSKSLSVLASKYYAANVSSDAEFPELQKQLSVTDQSLSGIYQGIFSSIVDEIAQMSYNPKEAELSVLSTLSEKKIFQDNTTVKYKHQDTLLPEDYNGLGYLNLFAIIFEIRIKLNHLAKKNNAEENPTPLNLLFIEEPEAHTHPQMQYIFINNIKKILKTYCEELGQNFSLQTIISTHSSHMVSQCDFKDIKYFYRESVMSVKSRSLKNLYYKMVSAEDDEKRKEQERAYRFVKQYVTLNRAELFFADKAILIEGDTERILFSAMMKKMDDEKADLIKKSEDSGTNQDDKGGTLQTEPLLSQNISVVEVGAYSHIFAILLGFLGIKTLIVTDLDYAKINSKGRAAECAYPEATTTSNASIKFFTSKKDLADIVALSKKPITLKYNEETLEWEMSNEGNLRLVFQKESNGYQGRSFEDAFLCDNLQFVIDNKDNFAGLKNRNKLESLGNDYFNIAHECINSKTAFALDILLYGGSKNEKWNIPLYIKEGLEWLIQ